MTKEAKVSRIMAGDPVGGAIAHGADLHAKTSYRPMPQQHVTVQGVAPFSRSV